MQASLCLDDLCLSMSCAYDEDPPSGYHFVKHEPLNLTESFSQGPILGRIEMEGPICAKLERPHTGMCHMGR